MEVQSPLYSRNEAARYLNISIRAFDMMLASGQIKPVRFGRTVRIHKDTLDSLARGEKMKKAA